MAGSKLAKALSVFSLASAALAAPMTSANTNILAPRAAADICSANSGCIPFTIELTWGSVDAVGAGSRGAILSNGSFPGPALRMSVGECVDFLVINNLAVDTGIHFHGIQQTHTPWSDGVPGLSQYAVQPGDQYMYQWTAEEQGAYFWHSHYKGQMMDGLYGAIFITPAEGQATPFSAIDSANVNALAAADNTNEPLFISDWSQYTFDEFYAIEEAGNVDIACADAIIINGMGQQYCLSRDAITAMSAPQIANLTGGAGYTNKACLPPNSVAVQGNYTRNLAAIPDNVFNQCTPSTGKNYTLTVNPADQYASLTFINPGGFSILKATIDSHKMIVYMLNGEYITPQTVDQVTVGNGERATVFVKLDQAVGDYQIRVANAGLNQLVSGFGVLSYQGASGFSASAVPLMNFGGIPLGNVIPFNPAAAAPFVPKQVSQTSDVTWHFQIQKLPNAGDAYKWTLAGLDPYSMSNDDDAPLLYKDPSTIQESDVLKKTNFGQWVDIIMETEGPLAQPHPIHKHSNKFFVIGQAAGPFTWNSVAEAYAANSSNFNLVNPPYLDGYTTLPGEGKATWTVFRYQVEIPGAWLIHCHMQTHFSGGMGVAILDGVDQWPTVPADAGKVCQGNGSSNSSWTPSCSCPATCPGNPSSNSSSSSGSGSGSSSSGSSGSGSSSSSGGHWDNGVWVGSNNPVVSSSTGSSSSSNNGYTPNSGTGSYGANGTSTTSSSGPIKTFTGAAASTSVSLFTVLALTVAAFIL